MSGVRARARARVFISYFLVIFLCFFLLYFFCVFKLTSKIKPTLKWCKQLPTVEPLDCLIGFRCFRADNFRARLACASRTERIRHAIPATPASTQSINQLFIWLAYTGNAHPRLQNKSQSWSSYCKSNTFRAWWWSVGCARRKSIRRLCNGVWVQSYNWYCQLISRIVSLDGMSKIWLTNTSHDYWRPLGEAEKCEAHGLELLLQLALHDCCRGLRAGTIVILFKLPDRQT